MDIIRRRSSNFILTYIDLRVTDVPVNQSFIAKLRSILMRCNSGRFFFSKVLHLYISIFHKSTIHEKLNARLEIQSRGAAGCNVVELQYKGAAAIVDRLRLEGWRHISGFDVPREKDDSVLSQ